MPLVRIPKQRAAKEQVVGLLVALEAFTDEEVNRERSHCRFSCDRLNMGHSSHLFDLTPLPG